MTTMRIAFKIEGDEFAIDLGHLMVPEAMALERVTGLGYLGVIKRLGDIEAQGWTTCVSAVYWLARKRAQPDIGEFTKVVESVDVDLLTEGIKVTTEGDEPDPTKAADATA